MIRDLICLTIDTDPDGMTAKIMDRDSLSWRGLENIVSTFDEIKSMSSRWGPVPLTWFIRVDGQIRSVMGNALALVDRYYPIWEQARRAGDAFGWHPHLYRDVGRDKTAAWLVDPSEAAEELFSLWESVSNLPFQPIAFRNGEGWHNPMTFDAVERMGFSWDSTAIPGRRGEVGHPMDWIGTPNHPYFPDATDIRLPGLRRPLLEIPLTTWLVKAPYDRTPRTRYINPAIHEHLFSRATESLKPCDCNQIWTLVIHPDEAYAEGPADLLYSRCPKSVRHNIEFLVRTIQDWGHEPQFVRVSEAGSQWLEWVSAA